MTIERHPITDREQWLSMRRQDVTASVIGALFNAHPYCTALRLYAEKRGTEFPEADNKVMRRGRWLEPAVAVAVSEMRPDWNLKRGRDYWRAPEWRIGATPDYLIEHGDKLGVLQIKTAAPSVYERDWLDGKSPPLWIVLQAATEMMLTNAEFGAIAVMLVDPHNMDVAVLDVPRNRGAETKILAAVADFWGRVRDGIEPEPDHDRDRDVIRAMYPQPIAGKALDLTGNNEIIDMLTRRANACAKIDEHKAVKESIESEIAYLMRDAEKSAGLAEWLITFKTQNVRGYTVPARTQRVLKIYDKREAS